MTWETMIDHVSMPLRRTSVPGGHLYLAGNLTNPYPSLVFVPDGEGQRSGGTLGLSAESKDAPSARPDSETGTGSLFGDESYDRDIALVLAEVEKQRKKWGDAHDALHRDGALGAAASVLAWPAPPPPCGCREAMCPHVGFFDHDPPPPPKGPDWAHGLRDRHDDIDRLAIAAALCIAEMRRLRREAR